jgi:hypothetical protein
MALGRLPPAHLAACGCTQINLIWIGRAAPVPKQDRRHNGYGSQELWVMPLTVRGTDSCVLGAGSPIVRSGTLTLVAAVGGLIA